MTAWEAILGGLIGVLAGMLANELFAWQPRLARWILEKAVKRTPEAMQARLREEWQADLATVPGKLSGVVFAASLFGRHAALQDPARYGTPCQKSGFATAMRLLNSAIGRVLTLRAKTMADPR